MRRLAFLIIALTVGLAPAAPSYAAGARAVRSWPQAFHAALPPAWLNPLGALMLASALALIHSSTDVILYGVLNAGVDMAPPHLD